MKVLQIHHAQVSIPKGAEDQARAFYCEVLGFRELAKPEALAGRGGFWAELGALQIHFGVEEFTGRGETKAHVAYLVDSLADWQARLTAAGIAVKEGISIPGHARFEFRDPFGNRVELLDGSPSYAPRLETERLILRGHRASDLDACFAMWGDERVVRHIGGKPSTRQQTWGRILNYAGHWELMGFGYWALEEKATGSFVGELGFADFKRDLVPSIEGIPELGWALTPSMHGKGYATEALRAAVAWGDSRLESRRTVCIIDPGNAVSLRVAGKCGFSRVGEAQYMGQTTLLFERVR